MPKNTYEIDTTPAEKAGVSLRGQTGRSYFVRRAEGTTAYFKKLWTDYALKPSLKKLQRDLDRAVWGKKPTKYIIEVGPPGRRS